MAQAQLATLETFLKDHPGIKYTPPSSPEYASNRKVWNHARRDNPLAIVRPESVEQVSALVKFSRSNGIKFTIRGGGHNLQGRAIAEGALTIDMRAFTSVKVASDGKTATVGAGILQEELAKSLWKEGLATPTGTIPTVGYVGWAMYGGYGPFSSNWGLGVDQIVAATIVDASGEIVKADDGLLKGIRGAGGVFGIILDVSIRVYSLKSILAGVIIYDSQNIGKAITDYNASYRELSKDGIPSQLTLQQVAFNAPPGRVFGVSFMWSSEDTEEGQRWSKRIASLGKVLMNTISATTIPAWFSANGAHVPQVVYGSSRTQNLYELTPELVETIGKNLEKLPSDHGTMFSIHQSSVSSATPQSNSVFASREPHFMLEILGYATQENYELSEQWAVDFWKDVQKTDNKNLLGSTYISLDTSEEKPSQPDTLSRFFGCHADEIIELKKKYDPQNVFDLTVPRLKHFM
ncbi:hypothetical protein UA08_04052 [Talaromyces atroroseus]|uniref:FAD-binding PCMH-type domain-containing protein n=1 Tax=Talaromyces atroroseus TaxID=1441469 RepID=A0A1Q5Q9F0_TALAT|nr:hypothetical protein UA08_04052 [Talaromyces atroroseus]OKL60649.1 hypothetical protein UA08_04052 [Talaromyces atroroseus]